MASGLSRRFGSNKLLRHVNGRPMFQHILTLLRDFQSQRQDTTDVVVVSAWPEILAAASKLDFYGIKNDHNERGISESIKLGLGFEGSFPAEVAAFFTADQPFFSAQSLADFLTEAAANKDYITCVRAGDRLGNPVAFPQDLFPELAALSGDVGGKLVVQRHLDRVRYVDVPATELRDIDRESDLPEFSS